MYVEQEDKHMPELSVRETLNFAALCHGTGGRRGPFLLLGARLRIRSAFNGQCITPKAIAYHCKLHLLCKVQLLCRVLPEQCLMPRLRICCS